jgi:hypothetical protein
MKKQSGCTDRPRRLITKRNGGAGGEDREGGGTSESNHVPQHDTPPLGVDPWCSTCRTEYSTVAIGQISPRTTHTMTQ